MQSDGGVMSGVNALIIGWSFPPIDSAVSWRTLDLANSLARAGATVTVLTANSPAATREYGTDETLARAASEGIEICTIVDDHPDRIQQIDQWPRERAADPAGWRADWLARAEAQFDEPGFGHALTSLVDQGERIHRQQPVDVVVAVAAPLVAVAAAAQLSERWGADLAIDFARISDEQLAAGDDRVRGAVSAAVAVWSADDLTRVRLETVFADAADRVEVIPETGIPLAWTTPAEPSEPRQPWRVGCFVEADAWTAVVEVIEGWLEARRSVPGLAEATLTVRGRIPRSPAGPRHALAATADQGVTFELPPSGDDVGEVYRELDVVVAVSRGDLPAGRTLEHLAAGRPVVWCTAELPGADHPLAQAAHVVRAHSLATASIVAAFDAAVRIDPSTIAAPAVESSWPPALVMLRANLTPEAGR